MTAEFLFITFTLFLAGMIAVPLASRFGLGSVLGYLIAGIAIGPVLHWAGVDVVGLQHFTEFGVVMMLFLIGLEMQPKVLWDMRARIFVMGGLQVGVTCIGVMAVAMMFGQPWTVALAIGLIFALSSTAIVTQTLNEKGLMRSDGGQASFSVLLFQDIAVIPMLALIPLLALPELTEVLHHGDDHGAGHGEAGLNLNLVEGLSGWQTALVTLAAVGLVIMAGRYLTGPVFRYVAGARLRELFVSTALMMVVGIALLMTMVGLSPALGTFLAGVVMANSEYRHELESDIAPFKGIFLGVFFITVGASIDFALLGENLALIVALTLGLIVLKAAVLFVLGHVFKLSKGDKWLFSLGLAQAGEFGFVLVSFTVANAVVPAPVADLLLLVVALSMLLTPALFICYDKIIAPRYSRQQAQDADEITSDAKIIIAGHGRFGGIVNRALRAADYETTVIDYSNEQLEMLRRFGLIAYFGDATRPDLLHAAGIDEAKILVIAIDNKEAATQLARYMHEHHPSVHVIARAIDRWHVYDLWTAGCRDIIRETYDSSIRAARSAFEAIGHPREDAEQLISVFEAHDRKTMLETAQAFIQSDDPHSENSAYSQLIQDNLETWEAELKANMRDRRKPE
ncbi:cation:proton antiporter domain-containing protein [Yoonia sediminilitoris]|uniref:Kef-type potassium/proton antiporter (CPA2 family) n=1 Tax=Yoonia sediminilitoris TaxID=1286148 RepID=A0A2T6KM37_9RHOB|nr:cation:proton antiporter [Yoonia sediminilitoris]PUB17241.1 Kef-type potassium/proton antiporter (CPA2 family) [Yoonia sediminilitoris]RCW97536.1 Kef-type potassium/proton antiporter (CPA2 family) [Yoonia sediminilitoris]